MIEHMCFPWCIKTHTTTHAQDVYHSFERKILKKKNKFAKKDLPFSYAEIDLDEIRRFEDHQDRLQLVVSVRTQKQRRKNILRCITGTRAIKKNTSSPLDKK